MRHWGFERERDRIRTSCLDNIAGGKYILVEYKMFPSTQQMDDKTVKVMERGNIELDTVVWWGIEA